MDELYEHSKDFYVTIINSINEGEKVSPQYYTSNDRTKEIYEFVDSITRIGIMNNQEKLENLKERIGKIEA